MDTKKLIEEVLRIGTQVRVSEPKKGDSRKNPFLTFCDPHGASSDPFGARTQDPNIKSVVLYQLS